MQQILAYCLARFSEPSSYAGVGAMLALLGWNLPDTTLGQVAQFCAAGCGLLALFLKERGLIGALLLVCAVAPMLSACSDLVAADSAIATACGEYTKGKSAADAVVATGIVPAAAAAKLTSVESYGDAACANPPAGDPLSTVIWLGQLVGQVATLTAG
ncbi:MAG TPA: hypothetical protein VHY35_08780 [Stellaceae bacterium]|jgi:hypothetical protein|nr:hypothetical protein [Stellaceae bacterium]